MSVVFKIVLKRNQLWLMKFWMFSIFETYFRSFQFAREKSRVVCRKACRTLVKHFGARTIWSICVCACCGQNNLLLFVISVHQSWDNHRKVYYNSSYFTAFNHRNGLESSRQWDSPTNEKSKLDISVIIWQSNRNIHFENVKISLRNYGNKKLPGNKFNIVLITK